MRSGGMLLNRVLGKWTLHAIIKAHGEALGWLREPKRKPSSVITLRTSDPWGLDLTSIYLKFSQIISNYLIFASNVQKDAKKCKKMQKMQKDAKKFKNMQKSAKTCKKVQKMQKSAKKKQNATKCQKNCNNMHKNATKYKKIQKRVQKQCKHT